MLAGDKLKIRSGIFKEKRREWMSEILTFHVKYMGGGRL
jgi:hypothetical protein